MDGIIIQARLGSTRLPNKIMLPFHDEKRLIDILIERIQAANPQAMTILATTTNAKDDALIAVGSEHAIPVFRGSENNVLDRFIQAAEHYGIDRLIRVCSDNPFLQTDTFATLFAAHDADPSADYVSFAFADGTPTIKSHLGLFAELTTLRALRQVGATTQEQLAIEHVTHYIYTHPTEFKINLLPLPNALEGRRDLRFTMDTPDDFALLQELYTSHEAQQNLPTLLHLVDSHPEYGNRMQESIRQNNK